MFDLAELQRKIQEARNCNDIHPSGSKYRPRTAAVEEASELLMLGVSPNEVSDLTNLPISVVLAEKDRIEEHELMRRKFLMTGNLELPKSGAGFTIFKR